MYKRLLILIICIVPVISVFSNGKKDKDKDLSLQEDILNPPRKVEDVSISNGRLQVEGDNRDIAFAMEEKKSIERLEDADTYTHAVIERPDGPIDMMEFKKGDHLLCWVGDDVRANMGPSGLKIFPSEGVDKIQIQTNGKNWSVSLKKETPIIWNDEQYVVFVSKINKGSMQDQPKFAVDLVIMRK
jgi:hypothetical protein